MSRIPESGTGQNSDSLVQDIYTRAGEGLIAEIESVEKGYTGEKIILKVSELSNSHKWTYDVSKLGTWNEDKCWLVELAKERGYTLEEIQNLEGDEVYVEHKEDDTWSISSEHPRDMFDEEEISDSITVEDRQTLESRSDKSCSDESEDDIELDCIQYETVGQYFVCEIDELNEIERDGACNIIECVVDTPYDTGEWEFRKPYGWDDNNPLVQLAESRNHGQGNFTDLVGDEVLVERNNNEWILETTKPDCYRENGSQIAASESSSPSVGSLLKYIMFWKN